MESVRAYYLTWFNEILTYNHVPVDGAFPLPPGPGLGTELHPDFLARSDLVREVARQSTTFLTGHALGNPYTTGNPW